MELIGGNGAHAMGLCVRGNLGICCVRLDCRQWGWDSLTLTACSLATDVFNYDDTDFEKTLKHRGLRFFLSGSIQTLPSHRQKRKATQTITLAMVVVTACGYLDLILH
jgi:hypothetical protein